MSSSRRCIVGFTLLELLIVVTIIGVFAALAVSRTATIHPNELRAAAELLRSEFDYARSLAVANNTTYQLAFDWDQNEYILSHTGADAALDILPTRTLDPQAAGATQQSTTLSELGQLSTTNLQLFGIDTPGQAFALGGSVEFGPLGETTNTTTTTVWLTVGDQSEQLYVGISVNPITGMARIGSVQAEAPSASL